MSLKIIRISIVLQCLLALAAPSPAKSAADITPPPDAFVSTEVNPTGLHIGETASVSVKLNNVPVEGYKSAEFTCRYDGALVEKSNLVTTDLFGAEPVVAIHDPQTGSFIVAIAGSNSNRAMISGTAFTFSAEALQAGKSQLVCTARVSAGDNVAINIPSIGADLTVLAADASPTPLESPTSIPSDHHHHTTPTTLSPELPTSMPSSNGFVSGQVIASKPVTVSLLDADQVEITSVLANPDETFNLTALAGTYTLLATASGFLSYEGSVSITAGDQMVFPTASLLAGDVDGNTVIDQFDALTIGMSYASSTPEAANLNNDALIDFLDLELLAENYRQIGPTTGSPSMLALLLKKPTARSSPIPGSKKTVIAPTATSSSMPGPHHTVSAPMTTSLPVPGLTQTGIAVTATRTTGTTGPGAPRADAPLCPSHDPAKWHGLWDSARGCHYDHEHGTYPFTSEVAAAFPGFDLRALMCGLEIGHCIPSGPTEHSHKHGGFKWNVQLSHPQDCAGHEGATMGVDGSVIQIHGFGNYAVELEASVHSVVGLLRQCTTSNPNDYGYVFVSQHVSYGEVASPYQGDLLMYPYYSVPAYDPAFGPYLTVGCIGEKLPGQRGDCRDNLAQAKVNNADSNWSSKPTGSGQRPPNSSLLQVFWRLRDTYQMFDWRDQSYPYTFLWLCSADGSSYNPAGCEYNNSTTQVHEVQGTIPASWDNLAGFDTDPRVGRITAQGFVTNFGELNTRCTAVGPDCQPIKMVQAFVGKYGSVLVFTPDKGTNILPYLPERDIYFCGGAPCPEESPGAVPSGWIGVEN
ncbi:MAG TPA: hypothetical protein VJ785_10300 [Anaerolineales bacterium]|nr:hypothetical protein [Anaerolineales bacterium]